MKFSSRINLSFCKQHTFSFETLGSEYYSLKFGYVHLIGIGGLGRCGGAHEVATTQEWHHLSLTPAQLPALTEWCLVSVFTEPFCLANYPSAFHSVMFNPVEPRLLATANSKEGVGLWDIRKPQR